MGPRSLHTWLRLTALALVIALLAFASVHVLRPTHGSQGHSSGLPVPATTNLAVLNPSLQVDQPARVRTAAADGRLQVGDLRGSPVIVNFWSSWCTFCRNEAPLLNRASRFTAKRGVVVLGVDQEDKPADARRFLAKHRVTYATVAAPGRANRAWTRTIPDTFFLGRSGRVVYRVVGELTPASLARGVDRAVAPGS